MKDIVFEYNVDGASLSSMKVGGRVKRLCRPANVDAFAEALRQIEAPFVVLGNGSNVFFTSAGYEGTVVLTTAINHIKETEKGFVCGAGASLTALAARAGDRGLTGLEFAYGIPGSVGGAVFMNAGAYGGEIKDVLASVLCADKEGKLYNISAEEAKLSYRHSAFMENGLYILEATFELCEGNRDEIKAKMLDNMCRRKAKQPLEYPSCGSTFKRPEGHFAGALIEGCGLKGFSVGGAKVSEKHAGFVINGGGATGDDVLLLIREVQRIVKEQTGVDLETEVRII